MTSRVHEEAGTCTDCGCRPVHWRIKQWHSYCRPCGEKNGHRWAFRAEVDVDDVLDAFGGDEAKTEAFLEATRVP